MKYTFMNFFAGAGLVETAMEQRWSCIWANDISIKKAYAFSLNHSIDPYVIGDIAHVSAKEVLAHADLAWASFPCQDLSLAGGRSGMSAKRSGSFWAFWEVMRDLQAVNRRPPIIVLENVVGLLYDVNFPVFVQAMTSLGMRVGILVIDAVLFLPQSRPRVFLIAVNSQVAVDDLVESDSSTKRYWTPPSLLKAISRLPVEIAEHCVSWRLPIPPPRDTQIEDVLDDPRDAVWHSNEETLRLLSLLSTASVARVTEMRQSGSASIALGFKRTRQGHQQFEIRNDGVAGCLRVPSGGSSRQILLEVSGRDSRTRHLSPRETARMMGLQDSFTLPLNVNEALTAVADGVAAPVVKWLSEHILEPLAERARSASRDFVGVKRHDPSVSANHLAVEWRTKLSEQPIHDH